jgi:hypothetical protein
MDFPQHGEVFYFYGHALKGHVNPGADNDSFKLTKKFLFHFFYIEVLFARDNMLNGYCKQFLALIT